jgi:hypothetical protein
MASSACAAPSTPCGSGILCEAVERDLAKPGPQTRPTSRKAAPSGKFFGDMFMWRQDNDFRLAALASPASRDRRRADALSERRFLLRPALREGAGDCTSDAVASGPALLAGHGPPDHLGLDRTRRYRPQQWRGRIHRRVASLGRQLSADAVPQGSRGQVSPRAISAQIPDVDAERANTTSSSWTMEPGDCLVFHAMIVHGAPGNDTPGAIAAVACRCAILATMRATIRDPAHSSFPYTPDLRPLARR